MLRKDVDKIEKDVKKRYWEKREKRENKGRWWEKMLKKLERCWEKQKTINNWRRSQEKENQHRHHLLLFSDLTWLKEQGHWDRYLENSERK